MRIERWLTMAGFGTWFVCGLPTMYRIAQGQLNPDAVIVWLIAFIAFGAAFALMCFGGGGLFGRPLMRIVLLAIQSCAGLTMIASANDLFAAATLVVVAGQLDELTGRMAAAWIVLQTLALAVIGFRNMGPVLAVATSGSFGGFQVFAFVTASLTTRERLARQELAHAHAELLATRELLAESSRIGERLRISRDLHDTLGHHLTALSLQLDVASRLSEGKAAGHVQQAHAITRLLLSDVREVVSELRTTNQFDLGRAIQKLAAQSTALTIHIDVPPVLEIDHGEADALLKCVQEIITNATRHAAARNLWIQIESNADGIALHARDDGRGASTVVPGNGLTGMRERFEQRGGRIEFRGGLGHGFEVHGFMPKRALDS